MTTRPQQDPATYDGGYPDPGVIWCSGIDSKSFWVEVVQEPGSNMRPLFRVFDLRGLEPVLLHDHRVSPMYGAVFGPDVTDVEEWQRQALEIIDRHLERS